METFAQIAGVAVIVMAFVGFAYTRKVDRLDREVRRLRDQLIEMQAAGGVAQAASEPAPPPAATPPLLPPEPAPSAVRLPQPGASAPEPEMAPSDTAWEAWKETPPPQPREPAQPSAVAQWFQTARSTDEWEQLIGGRGLNIVGALALILGAGFFLKYAFDHNWISPALRVAMGVVLGVGLLALGFRAYRRTYVVFSQGLVGAGIAILYLSVYASFNFYHLIPQPVALAAMAVVTVIGFGQALYYNSLAIALLAWFGGFLTPVLLMSAGSSQSGLAIYVALLVSGLLLLVARKEEWFILQPLTFVASFGIYILWYNRSYTTASLGLAVVFATILWALFFAKDVADIVRSIPTHGQMRQLLATGNSLVYYGILLGLLLDHHRAWMAAASLILAVIYCGTIIGLARVRAVETATAARFALTAIVLLIVATGIQFSGFTLVILWAAEALALLEIGRRGTWWYVWIPALGTEVLAALLLISLPDTWWYAQVRHFTPLFNERAVAYLALTLAAAASAFLIARMRDDHLDAADQRNLVRALQFAACAVPLLWLTVETNDFFRLQMLHASGLDSTELGYARFLAIGSVWTVYALILLAAGLRLREQAVVLSSLGVTAFAVVEIMAAGVRYVPIQRFVAVLNFRTGVFVLLAAALVLELRLIRRSSSAWMDVVTICIRVTLLALGLELLTVEINDYFSRLIEASSGLQATSYGYVRTLIIAGVWTLYSLPIVRYGVVKRQIFTISAALATAGLATIIGASVGAEYQPLQWFVPVLNIRALVLVLLLAGLFVHMQTLRQAPDLHPWIRRFILALEGAIVLLGFELVTVETRDFFEHALLVGNSLMGSASELRNIEQVSLSVVWLLYAVPLMVVGIWKRSRWLRFGALALFAITILKVFLYDLSFLGGTYRSISFAGLGVILLTVSFMYQRFKAVLFGPDDSPAPQGA